MRKILITGLAILSLTTLFTGCDIEPTTTAKESIKQEELLNEALNQTGLPNITNYTERKLAKKIFEMRDDAELITYAYTKNMDGKYVFISACLGYGLPYSVQYTNPEYIESSYSGSGYAILPQADPNGLYMPEGLSATWLVMIDEETGEQTIAYLEPEIIVTQEKLPRRLVEEWSLPENY